MPNPRYLMGPPPSHLIPAPIGGAITNASEGRLPERNPSLLLPLPKKLFTSLSLLFYHDHIWKVPNKRRINQISFPYFQLIVSLVCLHHLQHLQR